jgi:IS5 family transposase
VSLPWNRFALPFKHHAEHRHHIPKPRYRVTNSADYDASWRRRGSLTVWFTDEAIQTWRAEPRTTPGGQRHYSALAISTALTMGLVFGLALRQTEGLIGSVIGLLGLDLAVPDHSTLSRRAKTLEVPRIRRAGTRPLHLLVDSTGLKLGGAGEWLVEKHGTSRRRSWRKLHIGVDANSGEIVAVAVTRKDIDDAAMVDALLDQIADPIAAVIVPPRAGAVASASAETAPTQRDRHLRMTADRGRMVWQEASGYNLRAKVEASIGRYKRVIDDALRSRTDRTEVTEVAIAAAALNRMLSFGRPKYVRIA